MTEPVRVLHVEVDTAFAQQAASWIARHEDDLEVVRANTAAEAIGYVEDDAIDCVVAGYDLPDEDGLQLFQQVQTVDPAVPFILLTDQDNESIAATAISQGVSDALPSETEPDQFATLATCIRSAVDRAPDPLAHGESASTGSIDDELENLERLHAATNRLYRAETVEECHAITIDAAVSILGFDWCMLGEADTDRGRFRVRAASPGSPLEVGELSIGLEDGLIGHALATGESHVVDDVTEDERAEPARGTIRSALSVPIEDWGVLQAVSTDPGEFDDRDLRHAELLADSMRTAVDLIESQRRLEQQRNRLDDFTEVVSHDLRNPLAVAMGHIELIEGTDDDEENIEGAMTALERMTSLIEHLQTLAREGSDLGTREVLELESLASAAWRTVDADEATLSIETTRTVEADRTRLRQLLENLLRNAVEHGGDDVAIRIGDLVDGFYVEDDGEGIAPDEREDIFQSGYSTADRDSGVGLTIVREIVDAHGWAIDVTAGTDGGARFEITNVG